jgi:hypothetical protein
MLVGGGAGRSLLMCVAASAAGGDIGVFPVRADGDRLGVGRGGYGRGRLRRQFPGNRVDAVLGDAGPDGVGAPPVGSKCDRGRAAGSGGNRRRGFRRQLPRGRVDRVLVDLAGRRGGVGASALGIDGDRVRERSGRNCQGRQRPECTAAAWRRGELRDTVAALVSDVDEWPPGRGCRRGRAAPGHQQGEASQDGQACAVLHGHAPNSCRTGR